MLRNYLAAALRNLVRNRLYAGITIAGLAVGFAAALLIALFVRDELTYDHWIPGHDRTYRVAGHVTQGNVERSFDFAALAVADALKQEFSEIEFITRITPQFGLISLRHGDREFLESLYWGEPNLFDVLPLQVIAGDARNALAEPDSIVLTRTMARKYFGRDTPVGEMIEIDRQFPLRVTAVLEDLPSDTHLNLGIIASARSAHAPEAARVLSGPDSLGYIYLRLAPGAPVDGLRRGLAAFNDRHPEVRQLRFPFWIDEIVPIADIHLRTAAIGAMKPAGSADMAYSALGIAILIMAVAGFNFVNLTTARGARRAVEVGVRKVSGARRRQLIAQFVGESVFYATLGMAAAVAMAALLLPSFNGFLQRTIAMDFGKDPILLAAILIIVALVGISAGAYPAFVLSKYSPATVMKSAPSARGTPGRGRQILVATQFAVLISLALVSTTIHRQVRYATTEALRYDRDEMLLINGACLPPLIAEMRALPGVGDVTCTAGNTLIGGNNPLEVMGADGMKVTSQLGSIDFGTFELFGLKPVAGRLFSAAFGGDAMPESEKFAGPSAVVINEAMSRALGFKTPQDAVGKRIRATLPFNRNTQHVETASEIIGVVQNFAFLNSMNLRENAASRIFLIYPFDLHRNGALTVKLIGRRIPETLAAIDSLWKGLGPPRPIERVFLNQTIDDHYREFTRLGQIMATFATIAAFISCLGLFGLAAFAVETRTKEIGLRKALGASRMDILKLMLWEFGRPVLWGSLIAWPAAYFIMGRWLEGFADRVDIGLWTFPIASLLALSIAAATVVGHALLVVRAQPVTALRYE